MYGVMRAIGGGAGIGALPEYMKISNNNLVPILPNANTPKTIIYFTIVAHYFFFFTKFKINSRMT
jgi:DNA-binding transcriptional LysR family regulator